MKKTNIFILVTSLFFLTGCGSAEKIDYSKIKVPSDMNATTHEYNFNFTKEDFEKIDGNSETLPLIEGFCETVLNIDDASKFIKFSDNPIKSLIDGKKDVVFSTRPTEIEEEEAKKAGVELDYEPILYDAFVFITSEKNLINGLTTEEIGQIFSGEKTNWKDFKGPDGKIIPILQPDGSNMQNKMIEFIAPKKLMKPATHEYKLGADGKLSGTTTSSLISENSISYTFLSYLNAILIKDEIKALELDVVKPTVENIKKKDYAQMFQYYAITRKTDEIDSLGYRLRAFALTKSAQKLAESLGYIGM